MIAKDLHVHTTYCDGKNTPEEMVEAAIKKGLYVLGFSVHSYTDFDESYCMQKERIDEYKACIHSLKEKYKDKIQILCGVEQDYYSNMPTDGFDYIIGSVHYLKTNNGYFPIDESPEIFANGAEKYFGGDFYHLAETYFKTVSDVVNKTKADIIGHFDLVSKFNEGGRYFDENNERYVFAYKNAVNSLLTHGIPFEINTGAISRGYKTEAYPNTKILRYIKETGGRVILSSDSHTSSSLCFQFDKWEKTAKEIGFEL